MLFVIPTIELISDICSSSFSAKQLSMLSVRATDWINLLPDLYLGTGHSTGIPLFGMGETNIITLKLYRFSDLGPARNLLSQILGFSD